MSEYRKWKSNQNLLLIVSKISFIILILLLFVQRLPLLPTRLKRSFRKIGLWKLLNILLHFCISQNYHKGYQLWSTTRSGSIVKILNRSKFIPMVLPAYYLLIIRFSKSQIYRGCCKYNAFFLPTGDRVLCGTP